MRQISSATQFRTPPGVYEPVLSASGVSGRGVMTPPQPVAPVNGHGIPHQLDVERLIGWTLGRSQANEFHKSLVHSSSSYTSITGPLSFMSRPCYEEYVRQYPIVILD